MGEWELREAGGDDAGVTMRPRLQLKWLKALVARDEVRMYASFLPTHMCVHVCTFVGTLHYVQYDTEGKGKKKKNCRERFFPRHQKCKSQTQLPALDRLRAYSQTLSLPLPDCCPSPRRHDAGRWTPKCRLALESNTWLPPDDWPIKDAIL
jgi:hypothetical protein